MYRIIPLIVFPLFLFSCNLKKEKTYDLDRTIKNENFINIKIDSLNEKKALIISTIFKRVKLVPLETNENCLIGRINHVEFFDDTFYVLDKTRAKALFVFDLNGHFIRKIGRRGKGPGEYITPSSFSIDMDNRQIYVLDNRRILIFTTNGTFINQIKVEERDSPLHIAVKDEFIYIDFLVLYGREDSYFLGASNKSGKILKRWLPFSAYSHGFNQHFTTSEQLFTCLNDVKYARPLFDTIFCVQDQKISPYIVLTTNNKITRQEVEDLNSIKDLKKLPVSYALNKRFLGISNYVESPDLVTFNFQNKGLTHKLFLWKKNNQITCTTARMIDDLALKKVSPRFYSSGGNWFISSIGSEFGELDHLIENIKANKFHLPEEEVAALRKLTPESNPVIVLYECREGVPF